MTRTLRARVLSAVRDLPTAAGRRARPDGRPPPAFPRSALAVPVLLTVGWLAVALWHLRLPYPSDQLHYLAAGHAFPHPPEDTELAHQVLRFGVTAPTRLAIAVFGYSQAAYYTVPLLTSLLLLLGTYALGTLLFSRTVGAAGAAVVIASTPVFHDATELLPDLLATGLCTTALAVTVAVRQRRLTARPAILLLLGVLLGWSYLVREFIVFVWPLVPVLLWRPLAARGSPWPALAWLTAPIAGLVAVEAVLCWVAYGDPLARLHAAAGHGAAPSPADIAATYRDKPRSVYLRRLWATLGGYPPGPRYPEGRMLRGLLLATVVAGLARPRRFGWLLAWCALLWVPLTLLGGILDPAAPKLRLQLVRYWFPIFPAFVLGGLGAVWLLAVALRGRLRGRLREPRSGRGGRLSGSRAGAAVAALPVAVVLVAGGLPVAAAATGWWGDPGTRAGGATQMAAFRSWMARAGGNVATVWADSRTCGVLEVFQQGPYGGRRWRARIQPLGQRGGAVPGPGDLVVLFDTARGQVCGACRAEASRDVGDPPVPRPGWRLAYATRDGVLRAYTVQYWSRPSDRGDLP